MLKSSYPSNSVNGQSCSYARLKTYANCARAEVRPASVPSTVAVAAPAAPVSVAAAAPAAPAPAPAAPVAAAPAVEGYLDPSPDSLPGKYDGPTNYTPSYRVPNYEPITVESLTSTTETCGGYRKILDAYSNMSGSSCTTNYINN
jgi:hypothetical protein